MERCEVAFPVTLSQVAGELRSLLQAYDAQLAAGRRLLDATRCLAEALAANETDEGGGDDAEYRVDRLIQTQMRSFDEFQAAALVSERTGQVVRRRFALQEWAWDEIRNEILAANGEQLADASTRYVAADLVARLSERQQALAELIRELMTLHVSIEGSVRRHLRRLSDRFRILRQGTLATRAYDAGMKGYLSASAMFIDRTR